MIRTPEQVARHHLDAVRSGDPILMAADYSTNAVLERSDATYYGRQAIQAYFETVPDRLGTARVVFDNLSVVDNTATFRWHIEGGEAPVAGSDVCTIEAGSIVHQRVRLATPDF